jgi:predicted HicB family RNase H-like nuclease
MITDLLKYKDYYASVQFSAEDEIFFGKVLGIEDLISFEGTSVKELKKAFYHAVDDYIKDCRKSGKEPNKTYKGSFNVRISSELHKEASIFAASRNISLNDFVKTAIHFTLARKIELSKELT